MKATTKVSISGIAFNIDNDAYTVLEQYLDSLRKHFERKAEGKEIVEDIESRLAELLLMKTEQASKVVTIDDANQVIGIMGKPSDMFENDNDTTENEQDNKETPQPQNEPIHKRLYRDIENKVISGVCSGLGNYFNIDPVMFRMAFVLTIFALAPFKFIGPFQASGVLIYLALWVSIPKAISAKQKLEMKGKDLSINNIEQEVRKELKYNEENPPRQHLFAEIIVSILSIFARLIGAVLMMVGVISMVVTIGFLLGFIFSDNLFLQSQDILRFNTFAEKTIALIVILTPLFILAYVGARLLFLQKIKTRDFVVVGVLACVWLGTITYVGTDRFQEELGNEFDSNISSKEITELPTISDTLYVNLAPAFTDTSYTLENNHLKINVDAKKSRLWVGEYQGEKSIYYIPPIRMRYKDGINDFQIAVKKRKNKNKEQTSNINIDYTKTDSLLLIQPIIFNKNNKWQGDNIEYIIYAPKNKKIIMEEPLRTRMSNTDLDAEVKLNNLSITIDNK